MFTRIVLVLTAILFASPVYAQKQKKAELPDIAFWSAPKRPHAKAFVPGLQAALQLTPEQTEKLLAAIANTIESEEIRALKRKGDPNATPDELAKANIKRNEASEKLYKEIDTILTRDQKALIENLNEAYEKVVGTVGEEFQPKIEAAKGNAADIASLRKEQAEAITTTFGKKLDGLLTNDQKEAVKKAADAEAKRAAENKDKPKPMK